ncbi:MAG TPA: putative sulfate exporter family transporter [Acidimicrobiia bacterium]|nr:putative sulfate exporter family transporter [Acidimicrobiia bacterium]
MIEEGRVCLSSTIARSTFTEVAVIAVIAVAALLASSLLGGVVSPIMIALVAGLVLGHLVPGIASWNTGVDFVATKVLRVGIALIGLRITLGALLEPGALALVIALGGVVLVAVLAMLLGPVLSKSRNGWVLLAVGTAICGNSAIIATAPVIRARERDVALAVGVITAFGTLALFVYPLIGTALGMEQTTFGIWAGTGINDTAQVVAAGEAYGREAATTAVTVKFVRNLLILPVVAGLAFMTGAGEPGDGDTRRLPWVRALPPFVFGFLALSAAASLGVISSDLNQIGRLLSTGFITAGMVAIGLRTRLAETKSLGWAPLLLGLTLSLALSIFSFLMVTLTS